MPHNNTCFIRPISTNQVLETQDFPQDYHKMIKCLISVVSKESMDSLSHSISAVGTVPLILRLSKPNWVKFPNIPSTVGMLPVNWLMFVQCSRIAETPSYSTLSFVAKILQQFLAYMSIWMLLLGDHDLNVLLSINERSNTPVLEACICPFHNSSE